MAELAARHEQRISEQEQAVVALVAGALAPDHQVRAQQTAHRLASSLGTFGFHEGARIAQDIGQAWAGRLSDHAAVVQLAEMLVDLRLALRLDTGPARAATDLDSVDVVVVDDDEMLARLVVTAVEDAGYTTRWYADGVAALAALGGSSPTVRGRVLLLDVQMPEKDGFDVLGALQRGGSLAEMRVIMLTASSRATDVLRARQLGAFDYVAKPFGIPLLLRRVQRALGTRLP